MAKVNWTLNDTIMPGDMNMLGQEINDALSAANTAETPAGAEAKALAAGDGAVQLAKSYTDKVFAESVRLVMSSTSPANPTLNTWWYEDLGEAPELGGGGGLIIGNASLKGDNDIWFDQV